MGEHDLDSNNLQNKKIGILLLIGIVAMPYVFVWFLLKQGYTKTARILGFSWLIIVLAIMIIPDSESMDPATKSNPVVEESTISSDSIVVETPTTKPEEVAVASIEDIMPQKQRSFIEVLKKAWEKSEYDYTEAEKYKLIKERKNSVSNGYQMTEWIGTVINAEYRQEANEISLSISLYDGGSYYVICVGTGASADRNNRVPTTIKEGSSLFDLALELESGDKVKFSGTLYLKDYSPWSAKRADDNPLDGFGGLYFLTKFTKLERFD